MKLSVRTKFTLGMVFIFIIIMVLLGFSAFYLNRLSNKTSAILKENYLSVVYAREMSEGLVNVNQEIMSGFVENRSLNKLLIQKELDSIDRSLKLEKGNITEPGEDKLVLGIETEFVQYRDSIARLMESSMSSRQILYFQNKMGFLSQQIVFLSQMNGNAIETKTDDAKVSSKNALTGMTVLGSLCFLIALSFIYSFASYFNERFFQLYNGIKEIVSSNYGQRLYFDGADEFYEISLLFNQMAEKLSGKPVKEEEVDFLAVSENGQEDNRMEELTNVLARIRNVEKQAEDLISKFEKKN